MESQNIDHKNHKDCCVEKTKETGMISWFSQALLYFSIFGNFVYLEFRIYRWEW